MAFPIGVKDISKHKDAAPIPVTIASDQAPPKCVGWDIKSAITVPRKAMNATPYRFVCIF